MKAIEAFSNLPATNEQVEEFSNQLIQQLNDGEIEPLKFKVFLKCIEAVAERIKSTLDPLAREEAEKYGKECTVLGAKVRLAETGTKYDYSGCNDTQLQSIELKAKEISEQKKSREKFLQSINGHATIVDESTGEVITIYPPVKKSTSSVTITL